jgi:hypothetical protein
VLEDGVTAGEFSTGEPREVARAILTLCISVVDPFAERRAPMAKVIELHQRLAAALADTPARA